MTDSSKGDASKKARRDNARETARIMREAEKKKRRRNRIIVQASVVLGAIAVAAIIVLVVTSSIKPPAPGPANMASDGILLQGDGSGEIVAVPNAAIPADGKATPTDQAAMKDTVNIVIYVDYQCPFCAQFEQTNASAIGTWVSQGLATVEYHPIAFFDTQSLGNRYSSRAANAAACVANFEPDSFFEVNNALFASQPPEGSNGVTDEQLASTVATAGATNVNVVKCINDETFAGWVLDATNRAGSPIPNSSLEKVGSTPTVLVNGEQFTGAPSDAAAFEAFVSGIATAAGLAEAPVAP